MKKVEYPIRLTEEDRVRVLFLKDRGKIKHFVIQYYALINGRWRTIMRIDTCHEFPHKHTYHLKTKEYKVNLSGNFNIVFTESNNFIKRNFYKIKENFLR